MKEILSIIIFIPTSVNYIPNGILCFHRVMVTQTHEVCKNEKCRRVFPQQFSQTFKSVTITLWKHRENIFYRFCEIKAWSNLLCFHKVMVNGFEPIRACIVSCLFYKNKILHTLWLETEKFINFCHLFPKGQDLSLCL